MLWRVVAAVGSTVSATDAGRVEVVRKEADRRVDVLVGGKPFTSYIWPTTLKKPVLYPIRTAKGIVVTRGFPLEPRAGERVDHPHHVGLWFNYGDVNGIDFWNNSDAIPAADRPKMGTIVHRDVVAKSGSGPDAACSSTTADWVDAGRPVLLKQETTYVFSGDATSRTIDASTTLTAQDEARVAHRQQGRRARPARRARTRAAVATSRRCSPTRPASDRRWRRWTTPA